MSVALYTPAPAAYPDWVSGSESALWKTFRSELSPFLRLVRIENSIPPFGTPDVYVRGRGAWVELKYEPMWPVRGGKLRLSTLVLEQVRWLQAEAKEEGGSAWIFAKIGAIYLVPLPLLWEELITGADPEEVLNTAIVRSKPNKFPTREMLGLLARRRVTFDEGE